MIVWLIRGKFNRKALEEVIKKHPHHRKGFVDGQYLYWSRTSTWEKTTKASIQVNRPSADRAFKRAKNHMNGMLPYIINIELVETDLFLPNGD